MIGRTLKMNVSNVKETWGSGSMMEEYEGTLDLGNYSYCMFRINDNVTDVDILPNDAVFQSVHNGMNLAFQTQMDRNRSYCIIEVEDYAATRYASKIKVYNILYNRAEWPYALSLVTEMESVY